MRAWRRNSDEPASRSTVCSGGTRLAVPRPERQPDASLSGGRSLELRGVPPVVPPRKADPMPARRAHAAVEGAPDLFADFEGTPPEAGRLFVDLSVPRQEAKSCTRCPLYKDATQTVFGEGPEDAAIMLVGEQPGDQEDLHGRPFVGPAGQVLDRAMAAAGMERDKVYVTNAVKHFKFDRRGKKRIHQRPTNSEVDICRWWLDIERRVVRSRVIVALGTTAIRGITGRSSSVTSLRGKAASLPDGTRMVATVHPSYLLRMPDRMAAEAEFSRFVADLKLALKAAG
ncbi:MAG: UdgX family uracil-DNA binding protein [Rhizobiales bacterium]|nr:UdgX family uracil-DNA binding protein [Hyphomicrobiales bacterium]